SIASMFNKDIAGILKGRQMPDDLSWLAPIDAWSCTLTADGMGIQGNSISGIGNQGMIIGPALGETVSIMQDSGMIPKFYAVPAPGKAAPPASVPTDPAQPTPPLPPAPTPATNAPADVPPLSPDPVPAPAR